MTTINTFEDILNAMEHNPQLRDALRRHILTDELLHVPAQVLQLQADVSEFRTDVSELKEGQARLETLVSNLDTGQGRLEIQVASMAGEVGRISGERYEKTAARMLRRIVPEALGLRQCRTVAQAANEDNAHTGGIADTAVARSVITEQEAGQMELADVVVQGRTNSGTAVYVLAEASITVQEHDIERARDRARILEKASGTPTIAAAVGISITAKAADAAQSEKVTFINMDPDGRYIPPLEEETASGGEAG